MSTRRAVVALSVLLLAAGLAVLPAWADSQVRIVRLSLVTGPVQIDRATGQGFEKAIANMPITQGMKLRTDGNSRAEVEFEDGTTVRLISGAEVQFPELALRSDGARVSQVRVDGGTVYFDVRHKKNDDMRLAFASQQVLLDHSVHFRMDVNNDQAQIAVFKGDLTLPGPVQQAKVKKNETLTLDLRDNAQYELAKGISPMESDAWDANRLEYHDYYASSNYGRSPYSYGRSDLNYYGSWGYMPGYGNVWRPFGVGYGWDPFSNGYWSYYPGSGYMFVSGYPWGWSPYRYGSWVFIGGAGWCWRPGRWNNWNPVTPVYNAPPSYVPPRPPVVAPGGGTPTVIVTRVPGGNSYPDPDGLPGRKGTLPAGDTVTPVTRSAPAGRGAISAGAGATSMTSAPASAPTAQPAGGVRMVPGPNGPVPMTRSPHMRDPDSTFQGGRGAGMPARGRVEGVERPPYRGGVPAGGPPAQAPAHVSPPAPRMSTPPPAPRMSAPAPAPRMSAPAPVRGDSKSNPK